jgi:hypothetical protein
MMVALRDSVIITLMVIHNSVEPTWDGGCLLEYFEKRTEGNVCIPYCMATDMRPRKCITSESKRYSSNIKCIIQGQPKVVVRLLWTMNIFRKSLYINTSTFLILKLQQMLEMAPTCLCTHTSTHLVCRDDDTRQFCRRDVPEEICDGVVLCKECVRIVFVNCAFHCSSQMVIRDCKFGRPWWPNVF